MCKKAILLVSYVILLTGIVGNVFADPNASSPSPANGTTNVPLFPMVTLTWTPGDYVGAYTTGQNGNGHHVFFNTDSVSLYPTTGSGTKYVLGTRYGHYRATSAFFDPNHCIIDNAGTYGQTRYGNPLPLVTTFYWSIMEVDAAHPSGLKGPVWSFTTTNGKAREPSPANGSTGVNTITGLSWTADSGATSHDVYFGTASPGEFMGNQTATTYDPCTLAYDTTYYWRIDEKNAYGTITGIVWNFTTATGAGDFDGNSRQDFADFAVFASAWMSRPGQTNWNPACDIASPKDNIIDWKDLSIFADEWLTADTQAPSVPTGLSASSVTQTSFTLSWTASTDNIGVASYEVFRNGISIGTTTSTSLSVTGLSCGITYTMTVRAVDDTSLSWSAQSTALNVIAAQCDFTFESYTDPSNGKTLPYRLFTPVPLDPAKQYPMVIGLHGSGESGTDNVAQLTANQLATCWADLMKQQSNPCYVVAPQTPSGWTDSATLQWLVDFTKSLEQSLYVDANRIYLTGLSMGGGGVWALLLKEPDLWAAAVPICGTGSASNASSFAYIPIWNHHGNADTTVSVTVSRQRMAKLVDAGKRVVYTNCNYLTGDCNGIGDAAIQNEIQAHTDLLYSEYNGRSHDVWNIVYGYAPTFNQVFTWTFMQSKVVKDAIVLTNLTSLVTISGNYSITWNTTEPQDSLEIWFSPSTGSDGQGTWQQLATVSSGSNSYLWDTTLVPNCPAARIRLCLKNTKGRVYSRSESSIFTISN